MHWFQRNTDNNYYDTFNTSYAKSIETYLVVGMDFYHLWPRSVFLFTAMGVGGLNGPHQT